MRSYKLQALVYDILLLDEGAGGGGARNYVAELLEHQFYCMVIK